MIYSQNRKVSASLCGTDAKLSVVGVLELVEDSVTEFTGELKIDGLTAINQYGAVLVFFKNHIKMFRAADWNENIVVESFISLKAVVRFWIDTCIKSQDGEMIAYSRIELCGIDLATKRIRKTDSFGLDDTVEVEEPLADISFHKKLDFDPPFLESVLVRSNNIDYVHHTNNIEYVKFLMNTFAVSEREERPIAEIEIHYSDQTFEGDVLDICGIKDSDGALFEIRKEGRSVLKCEMRY